VVEACAAINRTRSLFLERLAGHLEPELVKAAKVVGSARPNPASRARRDGVGQVEVFQVDA